MTRYTSGTTLNRFTSQTEPSPFGPRQLATLLARHQHELASRMCEYHFDPDWLSQWKVNASNHTKTYFTDHFLTPLLHLLIASLRTHNDSLLCVYLDERLRFAPHREDWARRAEFHQLLLSKDLALISSLLSGEGHDLHALQKLWDEIHDPLLKQISSTRQVTILGVGDCLLNEVRVFLPARGRRQGVAVDMRCAYFSASITGGLDTDEIRNLIKTSKVDLLSFSFFSYEGLPQYVHLMGHGDHLSTEEIDQSVAHLIQVAREFLLDLRTRTRIPFLLHTVSGLPIRRRRQLLRLVPALSSRQRYVRDELNKNLSELAAAIENCLIVNEESVVEQHGGLRQCSKQVASQREFKGLFHISHFGDFLSQIYLEYATAYALLRKAKVICIDFDNTLWRGVMADEQVEHFHERERLLVQLRDSGILLIALSKNSEENIRWADMILKPDDFAIRKINWNTKAQSIKECAQTLNLGVDSFVVIDDSVQERALISAEFPELVCLDAEDETTWTQLKWLLQFPNTQQTEEARNRTKLYQEQAERQKAMSATVDYPEMMASLKLWYRFEPAKAAQINRISELMARTNQFNTTTIRYAADELRQILETPGAYLFTAELGDRFGSFGVAVVVILREQRDGAEMSILVDSFVMSCRAMGFTLEDQITNEIKQFSRGLGAATIVGRYVPTDRNGPCAQLFSRNGFVSVGETDSVWSLTNGDRVSNIPWLRKQS